MDRPGVDDAWRRQLRQVSIRLRYGLPRRLVNELLVQLLSLLPRQGERLAIDLGGSAIVVAIDEVRLPPAWRCLDRVGGGHGRAGGEVLSFRIPHAQLPPREGEVLEARRQLRRCHADVAGRLAADSDALRNHPWVGHVVGRSIENDDVPLSELGVVAQLDFEAHREAEAAADVVEVIVAADELDLLDRNGLAEIDLHPLDGVLFRLNGAVVAELGPLALRSR